MEYVLTTDRLSKKYKHFQALNNLTMHIPKGSIYGFVGRNGAGKTTLIRLICGLQMPTSGSFTLYGIQNDRKEIIKSRRRMGAVVETPSIYLDMTAEENLKQQYLILGLPSYEGISELLRLVGLENTGKKKARNFSLGMKQRLGIAVALAGDPDFLVLDEPVNGLDPQGIVEMRELLTANLRRLWRDKFLYITCAVCFVMCVINAFDSAQGIKAMAAIGQVRIAEDYFYNAVPMLGLFLGAFASLFFGAEHADGTLRNKLTVGRTRGSVYLASFLTCFIGSFLLLVCWFLGNK